VVLKVNGLAGPKVAPARLEVRAGEVVGISGLLGSGRTELLRLIIGADRRTAGSVDVGGVELSGVSPRAAVEAGIVMVSEDRRIDGLLLDQSIEHNVSISAMARGAGGLASAGIVNGRAEKTLAETMRGQVALACRSVRQRVRYLSGGNQQKVALARCLAADAKVLLLDEPTKGVDVGARAEVYRLIDEAAANGAAVLVVSSYNSELIELCDRILVMARGDVVAEFPRGVTDHELTMAQQGSNYVNN
jgi:ABC-type sugar transport system ATPase subunit